MEKEKEKKMKIESPSRDSDFAVEGDYIPRSVEPEGTPPRSCPPPLHRPGSSEFYSLHRQHGSYPLTVQRYWQSWKAGIFDCYKDQDTCCMTAIAPCIIFGRVAQFVNDGSKFGCLMNGGIYCLLSLVGLHCCYSCGFRERLRKKLKLPGNSRSDFCVHCLLECCALCQEYHQVKHAAAAAASGVTRSDALSPPSIHDMKH